MTDKTITTTSTATDISPEQPPMSPLTSNLMLLIAVFTVFYFIILRPQAKKAKGHRKMLSEIKRGDSVTIAGGIKATVKAIKNDSGLIEVEIADKVVITVLLNSVSAVNEIHKPAEEKQKARTATKTSKKSSK